MDKIDLLLWVMGGGFTVLFACLITLYKEIKETKTSVHEFDRRLSSQIADIDKRLYGIETLLHMKDCCILKSDQQVKKAE